jgi:hypothetical protein
MRNGFSFIFLLISIYAFVVNWRLLKVGSDKIIFIVLAGLVLGMYVAYNYKINIILSPANRMVKMIDRYYLGNP